MPAPAANRGVYRTTAAGLTTNPHASHNRRTGGCQAHYRAILLPKSAITNER
jgi:hypothetical protein